MNRRQLIQTLAGGIVLHTAGTAAAQAGPVKTRETVLSSADLCADLKLLERLFETLHPGLLRYQTESQWRDAVAALEGHWASRAEHRLDAAYVELSRLLSRVRCGHTYANFFNQRPAISQALFAGPDKLPLTFAWWGERMVVTGGALKPGTEILSLDGQPVSRILQQLMPLVRTDGHNDAKKRALLGVNARSGIETFDVFFALTRQPAPQSRLEVREPGTSARFVELPLIDLAQRRAMNPVNAPPPSDASPPWSLKISPHGHAVLTMPGWGLYNSRWDWATWLNRQLDEVVESKATHLIVDLRMNEGGLDCGDVILSRCLENPLRVQAQERLVRYRKVPDEFNAVLDTWDNRFRDWGDRAQPGGSQPGFFRLLPEAGSAETGGQIIEPRGPRFRGALRVLVSSTNSSATFRFASLVREHRLGLLVGEGTGGNQRGINGGAFFFVRLPGTGLEVDLPLIGYYPSGPLRPDAGLQPDIAVAPSLDDVASGRDPVLAAALRAD